MQWQLKFLNGNNMRLIKLGLISFVVLGLLITIISLLMPSTIFVSRSININAPKDSVYAHIYDLKLWKDWCANMEGASVVYPGNTTGLHAAVKVDKTTITIDSLSLKNIYTTWQTPSSQLTGSFSFLPNSNPSVTSLQWQFVNHVSWYPWEKFAAIFSDKAIGGFMEKSLDKIKLVMETSN